MSTLPGSVDEMLALLLTGDYFAERSLATVLYLALKRQRPLFLEGEAGVGKTELAKVLSKTLNRRLIRLQCYEGLDSQGALYDWNYAKQMTEIRLSEASGKVNKDALVKTLYSEEFLLKRPLLQALSGKKGYMPVLLIDELDRADEAFDAYLLELLSEYQITIPEIGTIKAIEAPIVLITSNRTREIHDALRRRCLYHWVDYPSADIERAIVQCKAPYVGEKLSNEVVAFVQNIRMRDLFKNPGISEMLDWATALSDLDQITLMPETVAQTLGVLLKYQDDILKVQGKETTNLVAAAKETAAAMEPNLS